MPVIQNMRDRAARLRRVAAMAHDPRIVEMVTRTAEEIEADIRTLEGEESGPFMLQPEPPPPR